MSSTLKNIDAAFTGESCAHLKYRYFARVCRAAGDEVSARLFEHTADQEMQHAFAHLDLLYSRESLTPEKCLQQAIDGETHEYTEMYPAFMREAAAEGDQFAVAELADQITESREHAESFKTLLDKAYRRFSALTGVEARHASSYQSQLSNITNTQGV